MSKASGSHGGRHRESVVWRYFIYDSAKSKSIWQVESGTTICGAEINAKYTTNLKAHLKSRHPDIHAEVCREDEELKEKAKKSEQTKKQAAQLSISDAVLKTKKYTRESEKYQKITRKLVGIGYVANSIVDNAEFRDLMAELDDRYTVPNRASLSKEMDKLFIDLKGSLPRGCASRFA